MSRVGRKPIPIPADVQIKIEDNLVEVTGPKGKLTQAIPGEISVLVTKDSVRVTRPSDERKFRALHGLVRSLVANMIMGSVNGFQKVLEIQGVGYRAAVKGQILNLTLGHSHPIDFEIPKGISIEVDKNNRITVKGIDKQLVGQVAANIRGFRPVEPYLGKGIRYEGEKVRRKVGKSGA